MTIALSIDGGGVRGVIAARILELLEKELNTPLDKMFDVFIGSSTGALIVCGIAHCKLPAGYICDNLYSSETTTKIMKKSWKDKIFGLFQNKPKYDGIEKRALIQHFAKEKKFNETDKLVMVPIYDITSNEPVIFNSSDISSDVSLLNVLDTASAAPGFFPSVEYKPNQWGMDSGIVSNNPSMYCYTEMIKNNNSNIKILSLGTGTYSIKNTDTQNWGGIQWLSKGDILDIIIETSMKNEDYQLKILLSDNYLRIDTNVKDINMDDTTPENIENLKETADKLWNINRKKILNLLLN